MCTVFMITLGINYPHTRIFLCYFKDKFYVIYYIFYQLVLISVVVFLHSLDYRMYIVAGMVVINIGVLIYFQPFQELFHNAGLVINQVIILWVVAVVMIRNFTTTENETMYLIFCYLTVFLLYIVPIMGLVRIIKWRKFFRKNIDELEVYHTAENLNIPDLKAKKGKIKLHDRYYANKNEADMIKKGQEEQLKAEEQ